MQKKKLKRLKGKKLHDLYRQAWERDRGICQGCGRYVPEVSPPHHIVYRSRGGEDVLENMVTLCNECHYKVHHGGGND